MEPSAPPAARPAGARDPSREAHRRRLVVLASGAGGNLQAVLDACDSGDLPATVVAVVSDRAGAGALDRASGAGIPAVHVGRHDGEARADYDGRLADVVAGFGPDVVVLAGWMRILTMSFLGWFPDRVVNLHPALPGELPGTDAVRRAWEESRSGERTHTGVMVHLVPDEGVDDGPVLATEVVRILPDDSLATLTERVHATEHRLLVATLRDLCTGRSLDLRTDSDTDTDTDTRTDDPLDTGAHR